MNTLHSIYDATLEYLRRVLLAIDMLICVLFGGQPGDTISYTAAVAMVNKKRWGILMCRFLNLFQANHCELTIQYNDHQRLLWGEEVKKGQNPL